MEFKELLSRYSVPIKTKANEEELIRLEENNFSETIINVRNVNFQFSQKGSNFIAIGFEQKEEEENDEGKLL